MAGLIQYNRVPTKSVPTTSVESSVQVTGTGSSFRVSFREKRCFSPTLFPPSRGNRTVRGVSPLADPVTGVSPDSPGRGWVLRRHRGPFPDPSPESTPLVCEVPDPCKYLTLVTLIEVPYSLCLPPRTGSTHSVHSTTVETGIISVPVNTLPSDDLRVVARSTGA